jgi:hypothetical protein
MKNPIVIIHELITYTRDNWDAIFITLGTGIITISIALYLFQYIAKSVIP